MIYVIAALLTAAALSQAARANAKKPALAKSKSRK